MAVCVHPIVGTPTQSQPFEVSQKGIRFAKSIFDDYGGEVVIWTSGDDIKQEEYDAIICLDVLEHIPDPGDTVRFLAQALRPGGFLVVHAPFWYLNKAVVTHLRSNRKYSGSRRLYRERGLRSVEANWFWNPIVLRKNFADDKPPRGSAARQAQMAFGAWLLWWGRFFSLPHVLVTKTLFSINAHSWDDLLAITREAEGTTDTDSKHVAGKTNQDNR